MDCCMSAVVSKMLHCPDIRAMDVNGPAGEGGGTKQWTCTQNADRPMQQLQCEHHCQTENTVHH